MFYATFESFAEGVLNDRGQVAFRQSLAGAGVDVTNDFAIWATDSTGALQLIAREGDKLEVSPGDFRTISGLNRTDHTANSNGWPSAFNNLGQLAFWASFTDGSQGIFVSNKVATVPGDFNFDGTVDAADYVVWRNGLGTAYTQNDYGVWRLARPRGAEHAVVAAHDALDDRRVRQRQEDDLHRRGDRGRRVGGRGAGGGDALRVGVVPDDLVTGRHEAARHAPTHVAQPDEPDPFRHR